MLKIDIWPQARDFIESLQSKNRRQIVERIFSLAENPYPIRAKLLEGFSPLRRFPGGDYRIIYFVDGSILKVSVVDKRGDDKVYRKLKRMFG